jgi:neurotrimin
MYVAVPPDIDDSGTSSDVTVEEGDNVTLSCSASGHPEPRILWRREDGDHIILQDNPHDIKKGESCGKLVKESILARPNYSFTMC